jgi:hypothetical protein
MQSKIVPNTKGKLSFCMFSIWTTRFELTFQNQKESDEYIFSELSVDDIVGACLTVT